MEKKVITIAREYGSGGRLIGIELAKRLGVPFYDKEFILSAARNNDMAEEYMRRVQQMHAASLLYSLYMNSQSAPAYDQVFLAQTSVIKDLAAAGPCVIVGRCADYVLRERKDCLRVFIHAPMQDRIRRAEQEYGADETDMESYVRRQDKQRASFYNYFTQERWGDARNYDLTINSSLGLAESTQLLYGLLAGKKQ